MSFSTIGGIIRGVFHHRLYCGNYTIAVVLQGLYCRDCAGDGFIVLEAQFSATGAQRTTARVKKARIWNPPRNRCPSSVLCYYVTACQIWVQCRKHFLRRDLVTRKDGH